MKVTQYVKTWFCAISIALALVFISACSDTSSTDQTDVLSDKEIKNLVERSYQYIAMFNTIQKFALDESSAAMFTDGFNKTSAATELTDHHMTSIARPNNDTLYQISVLDLRDDAMIIEFPAIDSRYAVLETSSYSHYAGVPLTTTQGDFSKPIKVLFYTERTKGYAGEKIAGIDKIIEADGDFFVAFLRAMPHQADASRMKKIIKSLKSVQITSLAQFQGKTAKATSPVQFPELKATDIAVFEENIAEVIQFVMNHTTFDESNEMDQKFLAAYKTFGIAPGNTLDVKKYQALNDKRIGEVARKVQKKALAKFTQQAVLARVLPQIFMPKGQVDLEAQVMQSVVGPIGLPAYQAMYVPISTPMNAQNDYVIKMTAEQLPPAQAFWSLTLYDNDNGFFIPNEQMKYSVGENAGFVLDSQGGIEIHISVEQPKDVPAENWLPINRSDIDLSAMFRIYHPALDKMNTWMKDMPATEVMPE